MLKITPTTHKERNSSIELYRIIATFTVLIVHFNGWFVGGMPERFDISNPSCFRIGQMVIGSSTCICVNMFLLISGYFGIKLKLTSVIKLCLHLAFIYIPFYIVDSIFDDTFSIKSLAGRFLVISQAGYFIQGYIMLIFFSPVLNAFVEKYGKQILPWMFLFLFIEWWFECVRGIEYFGFNHGYSVIHFILIYIVAKCIALYKEILTNITQLYWIIGYVTCTLIICIMYILGLKRTFDYSNPVVVLSSVCSFIPFLHHVYYNRIINWVAGGTLAVYIIQVTNPVYKILTSMDNYLLMNHSYPTYLFIAAGIIIVTFIFSVLYYKVCEFAIDPIMQRISPKIEKYKMI